MDNVKPKKKIKNNLTI